MSRFGSRGHAAAVMIALFSVGGCNVMNSDLSRVSNPLTPEQAKAQVLDAAREVVQLLNLRGADAFVGLSSCSDENRPPFRGSGNIGYPKAPSYAESDTEVAAMIEVLQAHGWSADPDFHSHGSVLKKNNVVIDFAAQNDAFTTRVIQITGECRDITTTAKTKGGMEHITFDQ